MRACVYATTKSSIALSLSLSFDDDDDDAKKGKCVQLIRELRAKKEGLGISFFEGLFFLCFPHNNEKSRYVAF